VNFIAKDKMQIENVKMKKPILGFQVIRFTSRSILSAPAGPHLYTFPASRFRGSVDPNSFIAFP
jgi:hypothetical protein